MTTLGTLNNKVYTTDDFLPETYAASVYQLIGDIYETVSKKWAGVSNSAVTVSDPSVSFTLENSSSAALPFAVGMLVYARPNGLTVTGENVSRDTYVFGDITAVAGNVITVNNSAPHLGHYHAYTNWFISMIGCADILDSVTVSQAIGGTGAADKESVYNSINVGDPYNNKAVLLYDDFTGSFDTIDTGIWRSERFQISGLVVPTLSYNATTNPFNNGSLITNAPIVYTGSTFNFNTRPGYPIAINTWADRPGVIGLSVNGIGSVDLRGAPKSASGIYQLSKTDNMFTKPSIQFPLPSSLFEFAFMFPVGEGFSDQEAGSFAIGFVSDSGASTSLAFNYVFTVGSRVALNVFSDSADYADPAVNGDYMGAAVTASNETTTMPVTPYPSIHVQEGRWYKVRMEHDTCTIYSDGNILYSTISGWTATAFVDNELEGLQQLHCVLTKTSGGGTATVLLDYLYLSQDVTR